MPAVAQPPPPAATDRRGRGLAAVLSEAARCMVETGTVVSAGDEDGKLKGPCLGCSKGKVARRNQSLAGLARSGGGDHYRVCCRLV